MGLQLAADRPLVGAVVGAVTGRPSVDRPRTAASYVPPIPPATSAVEACGLDRASSVRLAVGVALAMLSDAHGSPGGHGAGWDEILSPAVEVWSPTIWARSRRELLEVLAAADAPFTDEAVTITTAEAAMPRVFVEWRFSGSFTNPCFLDDDLLLEATGRTVESAGMLVVTYGGDSITSLHCYYDQFALLDQLLRLT